MISLYKRSFRIGALLFATTLTGEVDFARQVLPILSENCFNCHGPDEKTRKGDLRLDQHKGTLADLGGYAAVVPGKPEESELLARITASDPNERMPPPKSKLALTAKEIATLKEWIASGASWERHWAFESVQRPGAVKGSKHPLDFFVERRLTKEKLKPNGRASKETLVRRLFLDLTGLPPSPEDVDGFLADESVQAWEALVDRALASPAFGERMAWNWLEAARYADSNGYQGDRERTMWPWRDWVVKAFNDNLSYDRFTILQLAGDLLPDAGPEQILPTAFNRNHMINGEGGRIAEENRVDYVFDMTETMGTVWLGLTLNCCRCHDHKFDPVKQTEYYRLTAFFNQTPVNGGGGNPQTAPVLEASSPIHDALAAKTGGKPKDGRVKVMVMADMGKSRLTYLLDRGLYNQRREQVSAGTPAFLPPLPNTERPNRLDLARWLVARDNPLTARVTVNRIWQMLFGNGLVKTVEDFGRQAEHPFHPELLDWLAAEFMESGWNLKALLKTILTSETYRRDSSVPSPAAYESDPENRLLARGPRFRMPSWMIRDQALAAAGILNRELGGKPVFGYQPPGVWAEATFGKKRYQQDAGNALRRRSLYLFWRRIVGPTTFFDVAKRQVCEVKPLRTNTPMHALTTLNDVTYVEAARAFAQKLLLEAEEDEARLNLAGKRLLARTPSPEEGRIWQLSLDRARKAFTADPEAAKHFLSHGDWKHAPGQDPVTHAAWAALCLNLFNLDETLNKE